MANLRTDKNATIDVCTVNGPRPGHRPEGLVGGRLENRVKTLTNRFIFQANINNSKRRRPPKAALVVLLAALTIACSAIPLAMAQQAARAETIDASKVDPIEAIREMTEGRGADICIDAVGMEAHRTFLDKVNAVAHGQRGSDKVLTICFSAVRRGGTVSVVGVYGSPYDNFPFDKIFDKGLRLNTGQAPVHAHIDRLIELVDEGKIVTDDIITHRLPLAEVAHGYEIFNKKQEECVKVVLTP